jgi:hypothetical protein
MSMIYVVEWDDSKYSNRREVFKTLAQAKYFKSTHGGTIYEECERRKLS